MQRPETRPRVVRIALALAVVVLAAAGGSAPAHAQAFRVLYEFTGGADGASPATGLVRDARGNLYGTTGIVFKVDKDGQETVLYRFTGGSDGANPWAGVIRDEHGNLYGTTDYGGSGGCDNGVVSGCGTVFKVDRDGHHSVLYSFTGADGAYPDTALFRDEQANLYGTTLYGGSGPCDDGWGLGCGTVFKLDQDGHQTVLYSFRGADGAYPDAALFRDEHGNLYGTTLYGGTGECDDGAHRGCGTVFKLDKDGQQTLLYSFSGADGASPAAALFRDQHGSLYGTTLYGGSFNAGTVFKLAPE